MKPVPGSKSKRRAVRSQKDPPNGGSFARHFRKVPFVESNSGQPAAFARTERALLRALLTQGGICEDGHEALAIALDCGLRSIQRAAGRMQHLGLLQISRRGYGRTARLELTVAGKHAAQRFYEQSADTPIGRLPTDGPPVSSSADRPIGRPSPAATAPAGFRGDAKALQIARITARIAHDDSPEGLARAYMTHVDNTPEIARIAGFLDEHGTLPTFANPTGLGDLDEGLRVYFAALARRANARALMRRLAKGVAVRSDDEP